MGCHWSSIYLLPGGIGGRSMCKRKAVVSRRNHALVRTAYVVVRCFVHPRWRAGEYASFPVEPAGHPFVNSVIPANFWWALPWDIPCRHHRPGVNGIILRDDAGMLLAMKRMGNNWPARGMRFHLSGHRNRLFYITYDRYRPLERLSGLHMVNSGSARLRQNHCLVHALNFQIWALACQKLSLLAHIRPPVSSKAHVCVLKRAGAGRRHVVFYRRWYLHREAAPTRHKFSAIYGLSFQPCVIMSVLWIPLAHNRNEYSRIVLFRCASYRHLQIRKLYHLFAVCNFMASLSLYLEYGWWDEFCCAVRYSKVRMHFYRSPFSFGLQFEVGCGALYTAIPWSMNGRDGPFAVGAGLCFAQVRGCASIIATKSVYPV